MSEIPLPDTASRRWTVLWRSTDDDLRARLLRTAVLPTTVVALLGIAATAVLAATDQAVPTRYVVLGVLVVVCVAVLLVTAQRAKITAEAVDEQVDDVAQDTLRRIGNLRSDAARAQGELRKVVDQLRRGEHPALCEPAAEPAADSSPLEALAYDIQQTQHAAELAIVEASQQTFGVDADHRVAVFVNLAHRLQSLTHRAIQKLDELEHQVEDPDLLKGLFAVDHLTTGVRRQAESLAVLGGAVPRRQWSKPVPVYSVLRSAVAEVEHYARVKVVPPVDGMLHGHAVADIIHLVAELVENATTFSSPETQVTVRTESVTAGLAIDIQDRGLGMALDDQRRVNDLLANPGGIDLGELLKDGRIGLYVVAELARRHEVAVRVQTNIYGGIDAVIVVPHRLLGEQDPEAEQQQPPQQEPPERTPALATTAPPAPAPRQAAVVPEPSPAPAPVSNRVQRRGAHALNERRESRSREFGELTTVINGRGPAHSRYERRTGSLTEPAMTAEQSPWKPPAEESTKKLPIEELTWKAPVEESARKPPVEGASRKPPIEGAARKPPVEGTAKKRPGNEARPPLPRRRRDGSYLVPELANSQTTRNAPNGDHDPGLMAAFQKGIDLGIRDDDDSSDHPI